MHWSNARATCHRLDADLAVVGDGDSLQALAKLRREIKLEDEDLFVGLSGNKLRWLWLDGENVSNTDDLWGPYEPSGDGRCGSFLKARSNSNWDGYGWRWNDLPCATNIGYICEQPLGMHVTHSSESQFLIVIYAGLKLNSPFSLFQNNNVFIYSETVIVHFKNILFLTELPTFVSHVYVKSIHVSRTIKLY